MDVLLVLTCLAVYLFHFDPATSAASALIEDNKSNDGGDGYLCERHIDDIVQAITPFLLQKYDSQCTFKIILEKDTSRPSLSSLQSVFSAFPKTISIFDVRDNLTYTDAFLDKFLSWPTKCVVNVIFSEDTLGSIVHDKANFERTLNFVYKLSTRDRSSLLLFITNTTHTQLDEVSMAIQFLKKRLRNYQSACISSPLQSAIFNHSGAADLICMEDEDFEVFGTTTHPRKGHQDSRSVQTVDKLPGAPARESLNGLHLIAYAFPYLPVAEWSYSDNLTGSQRRLKKADGIDYQALRALSHHHNFTFELALSPDGNWGILSENGSTYNGMIAGIIAGYGDLALGDFFQMYSRALGAGFALHGDGCTQFAVPAARRKAIWVAVIESFTPQLWGLFFGAGLGVWLLRYLINSCTHPEGTGDLYTWMDLFNNFLASDMGYTKGGDFSKEHIITRIAMQAWIVFAFFFSGILFKDLLTKHLTALEYQRPVSSVEELVEQKLPLQWSELIQDLDDVYGYNFEALTDGSITTDFMTALDELSEKKRGDFGLLGSGRFLSFLQRSKYWDPWTMGPKFEILGRCFLPANTGWVFPKHTFWGKALQTSFLTFNAAGLFEKWDKDVAERARKHAEKSGNLEFGSREGSAESQDNIVLSLQHLGWLFAVWGIGLGIAMLVFAAEMCRGSWYSRQ